MRILPVSSTPGKKIITETCRVLRDGGMVIYPTETCYGIGVDATKSNGVERLLQYKGARGSKAISTAVSDEQMARAYVEVNEMAEHLYRQFLPGPITVVSKSLGGVERALVSEQNTLGIRIPAYPLIRKVIQAYGKPITATSANTSGKKPPYSLKDWQKYTSLPRRRMVDLFLDGGELPKRQPSTVVDTTLNEPTVLRQGEIVVPHSAQSFGSGSAVDTSKIGGDIMCSYIRELRTHPIIIAIQGELGAGKTQLAKGIAQALGVKGNVPSPTYTIIREYAINSGKLYHIDTWRLDAGKELWDLGLRDMLKPGNVLAIEWLQKMREELDAITNAIIIWVDIQTTGPSTRQIRVFKQ